MRRSAWPELRGPIETGTALLWFVWSAGSQRANPHASGAWHTPRVHGKSRRRWPFVTHSEPPACCRASFTGCKWSCAIPSTRCRSPSAVTYAVFDAALLADCLSSNWWRRPTRASTCGCPSASSYIRRAARWWCLTSTSSKPSSVSRRLRRVTFLTSVQCRVCNNFWVAISYFWWYAIYAPKFISSITRCRIISTLKSRRFSETGHERKRRYYNRMHLFIWWFSTFLVTIILILRYVERRELC